jgi:hypothetical protein
MFDPELQKMRGSLIVNSLNQLAFLYSGELRFTPVWASIDIERGEIFIGTDEDDPSGEGVAVKLGKIDKNIYERVLQESKILLGHFRDGDIRKIDQALWVPLTVAHQHSSV